MTTDTIAPAAPAVTPAAPSVHRRALLTWLAVYPTITTAFLLLGPYLGNLPLALRTLVMTALVVPVVVYALMPLLLKAETRLTRRK
ncbi:hypothetical protein [Streptomyces sp. CBMA123]|uniref:hypothetical protein n=1 Tax=Streptomyces sp. CBMA123 TaxID=1896313 RepID=UPI001661B241|nr:hypothetical protein [Streptomyces sp. CBMA123]MBD0691692.1 hypothetical protein [Streptomyces sp. CBMA123]